MTDYCHLQLLCKLIGALRGLAKELGPWPTVIVAALVLGFAAFLAHDFVVVIELIVRAAFAALFIFGGIKLKLRIARVAHSSPVLA